MCVCTCVCVCFEVSSGSLWVSESVRVAGKYGQKQPPIFSYFQEMPKTFRCFQDCLVKIFISENSLKLHTFPGMPGFIMTVKYIYVSVCMSACTCVPHVLCMCTVCVCVYECMCACVPHGLCVYVYSLCMCV